MFNNKTYSLRKSHRILMHTCKLYKSKGGSLSKDALKALETNLQELDAACLNRDRETADKKARWLENFSSTHLKKNLFDYAKEFTTALLFALVIATIVRQSWFEIYEIPTGSMRPTFKEQDDLTVSKTPYGLNIPLKTDHFAFYPERVQRGSIIIFTGDGIDLPDTDTTYFGLFPAKKRYTKRMIGLPGDTLYFYGGLIYGIDKDGNLISELTDSEWMKTIEHIPFITFEGKPESASSTAINLKHMNIPIGRLNYAPREGYVGEVAKNGSFVREDFSDQKSDHPKNFGDFYGLSNFGKARILTKEEYLAREPGSSLADKGVMFLEIAHFPNLTYPKPILESRSFALGTDKSYIPLTEEHLKRIQENLYTARFVVKNGFIKRYNLEKDPYSQMNPKIEGVPDGTYELYFGKAHKIGFWGVSSDVPKNSGLYDIKNTPLLYNLGIEFVKFFEPGKANELFPSRFAYFRDGDLYLLGSPIFKKDDPLLVEFVKNEEAKGTKATRTRPYKPFVDHGVPSPERIEHLGLKVPDKQYFVLGDNHAMSSDSRFFGFVPQNNLQGAPSLLIWPPGDRMGLPYQKPYPFLSVPRLIVWSIAGIVGLCYWLYVRRRNSRPYFHRVEFK